MSALPSVQAIDGRVCSLARLPDDVCVHMSIFIEDDRDVGRFIPEIRYIQV